MHPRQTVAPAIPETGDSEALLEAHFAASPTGILITDPAGEVRTYNDRFLQLWCLSPEAARNATAEELLRHMSQQVANREGFVTGTRRLWETPNDEVYGELIHLDKARTLSCNTRPVRAADGRLLGRVWDYQDVTDVVAARSELRLARYTLDHASTAVLWIEEDGTIASANRAAAKSLGRSVRELQRMKVWGLSPDRTPASWAALWEEIEEQGRLVFESVQVHSDGTVIPIEVTAHFFRFDTTELVCGFIRDLTESRRAEEERRRLERSIQQAQKFEGLALLASGIAHDFNNLLVGILGNSSLALESAGDDEELKTCLEQIRDAGEHATALTSQMMAYAGRSQLELESIDLSELVRETMRLLAAGVDRNCRLTTDLAADLPAVEVDPTQIRQVLVNLVTNGSEALRGAAGSVSIATRFEQIDGDTVGAAQLSSNCKPGPYVAIEIRDSGVGMDDETLRRIFDPFFTTKLSAHGLGLAAVRGIVHQHRGLLRIDSEPGRGSTFTVLVPASKRAARSRQAPAPATSWTASGRVLLVDDNPHVLEVGRRMLEIIGFTVASYESGAEAVTAFAEDPSQFRLAVVDLTMPEMDGSEVASRLRELESGLPILLSSGYSEMEVVSQSEAQPGVAYLPKPYTLEELRMRVESVVCSSEADDEDWLD